jgi:predicted RND superfamily exporter protein
MFSLNNIVVIIFTCTTLPLFLLYIFVVLIYRFRKIFYINFLPFLTRLQPDIWQLGKNNLEHLGCGYRFSLLTVADNIQ